MSGEGFKRASTVGGAERGKGDICQLLQKAFAEYYKRQINRISGPSQIERREFGFLTFKEEGVMIRHKMFKTVHELREFITQIVPSDVYYSSAYYEEPQAKMDLKGWRGADLIFDIDADHIELKCKEMHDYWACSSCGLVDRLPKPGRCPSCDSEKLEERAWLCEDCLEAAKLELMKLVDILTVELGFSTNEIKVYFSGHRGYHLHVESEKAGLFDQMARKEIVDYLLGTGLKAVYHVRERGIGMVGWRERILKGLHKALSDESIVSSLRLKKRALRILGQGLVNLDRALADPRFLKAVESLINLAVKERAVHLDPIVTTDLHRLIRLPNTLHGKTGLLVQEVNFSLIDDYDPLSTSVVLNDEETEIYVEMAPKFRLKDVVYGPYKKEKATLPLYASVYLLLKGCAKLI